MENRIDIPLNENSIVPHPRENLKADGGIDLRIEDGVGILETVASFARKIAAKILTRNFNIITAQRPALLLTPFTQLQLLIADFALITRYAKAMCGVSDPVERMKLLTAGIVGNLCYNAYASGGRAPIIPRLGETFQGRIDDCRVFAEHLALNPHTSQVQIFGPNGSFSISAYVRFDISISLLKASAKVKHVSRYVLKTADNDLYEWEFPSAFGQKKDNGIVIEKSKILPFWDIFHSKQTSIDRFAYYFRLNQLEKRVFTSE